MLWLNANFRNGYQKQKFNEKLDAFDLENAKTQVFECIHDL